MLTARPGLSWHDLGRRLGVEPEDQATGNPLRLDGIDRMRLGFGGLVYVLIGVILAASNDYFDNVDALKPVLEALLAILLWPLLLLGVDFDIN
ncbi:MAG: hypothetical protein M3370_07630 [Actinomycetota bacterium]|nr:hypothetical protein [Actinomycetota bacterium]